MHSEGKNEKSESKIYGQKFVVIKVLILIKINEENKKRLHVCLTNGRMISVERQSLEFTKKRILTLIKRVLQVEFKHSCDKEEVTIEKRCSDSFSTLPFDSIFFLHL